MPTVYVLSGGSGRTANQLLQAALAQFPGCEVELVTETEVRTVERSARLIGLASERSALICHSLVDPVVRQAVETEALRLAVPCIDVLGPAVALLADHLRTQPRRQAGLLRQLHREQFDRMDAMDFTLAHDDGNRLASLHQADVVLVGASRTTKSVTCCYLAFRGLRAANVPLIPGQAVPEELLRLAPSKVIGLTMNAAHLTAIRQSRLERITNRSVPAYAERRDIQRELIDMRRLMELHHWQCIDISYKATEEVAARIVELLPRQTADPNLA